MAETRREQTQPERPAEAADSPKRQGDVLGLGSTVESPLDIPPPEDKGSGHATGIDVRTPATGTGELTRGSGATGIDMGAGGGGTDITPESSRPTASRRDVND